LLIKNYANSHKMKKIILSLITAMTMSLAMNAQQIETPFAYPQAPDTL